MIDILAHQVWLAPGATDMRKSIDGLCALAHTTIGHNPLDAQLFAFCSKDRSKIKLLYWDRNGFWLFYKRLEQGNFQWPQAHHQHSAESANALAITRQQLSWLLDGLAIDQAKAHRPLHATVTV